MEQPVRHPEYGVGAPYLTGRAAEHLVETGAALVGIDSVNIDDIHESAGGSRPAHTLLLEGGIPIVEHLTSLDRLPARGARFFAVPPALEGVGTVTVRAIALLES